ncbi:LPXTG cell wall anchor domain-containing protein [Streptomyces sp. NPDC002787]
MTRLRKNLSKGMLVTAAATSVLSLYVAPAFADSTPEETPAGSLGLPDAPAALPSDSVRQALENVPGHDSGYGEDIGYGDDYGYDYGYGDTPPTKPPTTPPTRPPTSPPTTPPPVKSPPVSAPPTTPPSTPPRTPPSSPPAQPPSLPETGGNEQVLAASGMAALLLTSGAILYRRGRAAAGR